MRTATVTLRGAEFTQKMTEMRMWLDEHFFEPIRFTYKQDREIIVISVDFPEDHHAEAFQSRFAGRQGEVASLLSTQKQVNRAALDHFGMPEARGTMAQACWRRLVAEEIRTEADSFGSEAAKDDGDGRQRLGATGRRAGASIGEKQRSATCLLRLGRQPRLSLVLARRATFVPVPGSVDAPPY